LILKFGVAQEVLGGARRSTPRRPNILGLKYVWEAYSYGIILREKKESEKGEGRYSVEERNVLSFALHWIASLEQNTTELLLNFI